MSLASRVAAAVARIATELRTLREDTWTYREALGNVGVGGVREVRVEFPVGRFSSSPMIVASVGGTSAGASNVNVTLRRWDAGSCTVVVTNNGGSGTNVWLTIVAYRV